MAFRARFCSGATGSSGPAVGDIAMQGAWAYWNEEVRKSVWQFTVRNFGLRPLRGGPQAFVATHELWRRRFGEDVGNDGAGWQYTAPCGVYDMYCTGCYTTCLFRKT